MGYASEMELCSREMNTFLLKHILKFNYYCIIICCIIYNNSQYLLKSI